MEELKGEKTMSTSSLQNRTQRMKTEILSPRHARAFAHGCARHPVLAQQGSVPAVLATMSEQGRERADLRSAITRAAILEHQAGSRPLWASLLAVAYYPMISKMCQDIVSAEVTRRDVEQIVVECFLRAIDTLPAAEDRFSRTAMYMRQLTRRAVFRHMAKLLRERKADEAIQETAAICPGFDPFEEAVPEPREDSNEVSEMERILLKKVGGVVDDDKLQLVGALVIRRQRPREYVAQRYPGGKTQADLARLCERVKRQRQRALAEIRARIGAQRAEPSEQSRSEEIAELFREAQRIAG
jgi:hypothetical protein